MEIGTKDNLDQVFTTVMESTFLRHKIANTKENFSQANNMDLVFWPI